jgi:hypothetical protein
MVLQKLFIIYWFVEVWQELSIIGGLLRSSKKSATCGGLWRSKAMDDVWKKKKKDVEALTSNVL